MWNPNLPKADFWIIPGWVIISLEEIVETKNLIIAWEMWISAVSEDWNTIIVTNRHVWEIYIKTPQGIQVVKPNWRDEDKNSIQSRWILAAEAVVTIDWVEYVFKTWRHAEAVNPDTFFLSANAEDGSNDSLVTRFGDALHEALTRNNTN